MPICTCPVSDERFDVPIWIQIREIAIATVETNLVIVEGKTILREIPRRLEGLNIVDGAVTLTEIRDPYQVLGDLEYRVDYNVGWIYFNNTYYADGVSIDTIEYTGRGVLLYPYERIIRGDGTLLTDGINSVLENGVLVSDKIGKFDFRQNIQVYVDPLDEHSIIINVDPNAGFGGAFLDLTDAPSTYVGQALKLTRVNAGQTAIEFIDVASIPEIADHESRITVIEDDINIPTSEESVPYNKAQGLYALSKDALAVAIHGINVLPVKNYYGRDLTQIAKGNFPTDISEWTVFSGTCSLDETSEGYLEITGTVVGKAIANQAINGLITGKDNFTKAYARVTYSGATTMQCYINGDTAISILNPVQNKWYEIADIRTHTGANNLFLLTHQHTTDTTGLTMEVQYAMTIPVPDDIITVAEMEALLDGKYIEFGNSWAGKPVELDQLQDNRNDFSADTTADYEVDKVTSQDKTPYKKFVSDGGFVNSITPMNLVADTKYTVLISVIKNTISTATNFTIARNADLGMGVDLTLSTLDIGIQKLLLNVGTISTNQIQSFLSSAETTGEIILRQAIIKGDYTHLTDVEALRIIKEQEFGTFEVKGTWITSIEKNKVDLLKVVTGRLDAVGVLENTDLATILDLDTSTGYMKVDVLGALRGVTTDYINVIFSSDIVVSINEITGNSYIRRISYYDQSKNWISNTDGAITDTEITDTVPSNAYYVRVNISSDTISEIEFDSFQLELGTVATIYEEFIESIVHIDGELHGMSYRTGVLISDDLDTQRFDRDYNDVVQSATSWLISNILTNTHTFRKISLLDYALPLSEPSKTNMELKIGNILFTNVSYSDLIANDIENTFAIRTSDSSLRIRVNKTTYATSGDFETYLQANDVELIYELDTYLPRTEANNNEIDVDGKLLVSVDGTYTQVSSSGVIDYFTTTVPLNLYGQLLLNILTDLSQQKEINWNKIEIEKLITDTQNLIDAVGYIPDLDTTATDLVEAINEVLADLIIAESDISDNVTAIGFNTTHRSSDGSDHSDVVLNTTHRTSNGLSHSQVVANKTVTDFITITEAFNADKAAEYTELMAAKVDVSNATSIPASNVTTTSSIDNYDAIDIVLQFGDKIITKRVTIATNTDEIIIGFDNGLTSATDGAIKFKFYRNSSTTFTAYYGRTISYGVYVNSSIATIDILKIYGVKFT